MRYPGFCTQHVQLVAFEIESTIFLYVSSLTIFLGSMWERAVRRCSDTQTSDHIEIGLDLQDRPT